MINKEAIYRQDVLDLAKKGVLISNGSYKSVCKAINEIPPVNPTKTGHWIEHPEIETSTPEYLMFYECSECGDKQCFCKSDIHKKHFCNNCGVRMVKPQESEDKECI